MANLIDGFREARAAHREQVQNDRRLSIEDQAAAATRGRPPTRSDPQSRAQSSKTPEHTSKGGQLVMTDANKRGRSLGQSEGRDAPSEGPNVQSEGFKKAKKEERRRWIMRAHFRKQ